MRTLATRAALAPEFGASDRPQPKSKDNRSIRCDYLEPES